MATPAGLALDEVRYSELWTTQGSVQNAVLVFFFCWLWTYGVAEDKAIQLYVSMKPERVIDLFAKE